MPFGEPRRVHKAVPGGRGLVFAGEAAERVRRRAPRRHGTQVGGAHRARARCGPPWARDLARGERRRRSQAAVGESTRPPPPPPPPPLRPPPPRGPPPATRIAPPPPPDGGPRRGRCCEDSRVGHGASAKLGCKSGVPRRAHSRAASRSSHSPWRASPGLSGSWIISGCAKYGATCSSSDGEPSSASSSSTTSALSLPRTWASYSSVSSHTCTRACPSTRSDQWL